MQSQRWPDLTADHHILIATIASYGGHRVIRVSTASPSFLNDSYSPTVRTIFPIWTFDSMFHVLVSLDNSDRSDVFKLQSCQLSGIKAGVAGYACVHIWWLVDIVQPTSRLTDLTVSSYCRKGALFPGCHRKNPWPRCSCRRDRTGLRNPIRTRRQLGCRSGYRVPEE
jgi:hypothetical protein